jgi:hypothetical protein
MTVGVGTCTPLAGVETLRTSGTSPPTTETEVLWPISKGMLDSLQPAARANRSETHRTTFAFTVYTLHLNYRTFFPNCQILEITQQRRLPRRRVAGRGSPACLTKRLMDNLLSNRVLNSQRHS